MRRTSMATEYFDDLYAQGDGDPWKFATSEYEQRKYAATLAALPRKRFRRALEIGCSIGILTSMLASRCDALIATEPAARALDQARKRCAGFDNVRFDKASAPDEWPDDGTFDLILLSEVVYYFRPEVIERLASRVKSCLLPRGNVLLVHWVRETDYPLSGDDAVNRFLSASPGLRVIRQERTEDYRLDLTEALIVSDGGV